MALVLSNQENIDTLLFWLRLSVILLLVVGTFVCLFWLRLRSLERRIYNSQKLLYRGQLMRSRRQLSQTRERIRPDLKKGMFKKAKGLMLSRRSPYFWRQMLILAVTVIGVVFTLIQLGGGFIRSELTTLFWLLVGILMFVGAAFAD